MKILLTNDDGINAPGLRYLVDWARTKGEVTVVAPKVEQSGKSHSIEIHGAFGFKKTDTFEGVESYSVDSTPADCVRVAIIALKKQFDLVISGINRGFNLGGDICYSGTVGACFEGAKLGVKSLAISTAYESFDGALKNLDRVFEFIMDSGMFEHTDILNVNLPENGDEICVTRMGPAIYGDAFIFNDEDETVLPTLVCYYKGSADLSIDTDATMTGHISVTPLKVETTDYSALDKILKNRK